MASLKDNYVLALGSALSGVMAGYMSYISSSPTEILWSIIIISGFVMFCIGMSRTFSNLSLYFSRYVIIALLVSEFWFITWTLLLNT